MMTETAVVVERVDTDGIAAQAASVQAAAQAEEDKAREEASGTLKAAVKAFRQGEKAHRTGLLETGRLAGVYVAQRLAIGDKRTAAVDQVALELGRYASDTVDVSRLVACYEAHRLLCVEPGIKADVPYGHYRDAYRQLVQRERPDTREEAWVLLPGQEQASLELFARAVKDGLGKDAVADGCKALQRAYTDTIAQAKKAAADKADADRQAARKVTEQADKAREEARLKAEKLEREAREATHAETQATITAAAQKAREEQAARDKEHATAIEAEAARIREKDRADKDAKATADTQAKAAAAAQKAAQKTVDKANGKPEQQATAATGQAPRQVTGNLQDMGSKGSVKDVADAALTLITASQTPDDVLDALLAALSSHKAMSGRAQRACQAALSILAGSPTSPVQLAKNGAAACGVG